MFDSHEQLAGQIEDLLEAIRAQASARYACLSEPGRVLFERAAPEWCEAGALRRALEARGTALFAIPASMASGEPLEDVFDAWGEEEFLLAVINGRVALIVACPDAEASREPLRPLLKILADRLLRFDSRYRLDERGRGFFLGSPKLELVVIGRSQA